MPPRKRNSSAGTQENDNVAIAALSSQNQSQPNENAGLFISEHDFYLIFSVIFADAHPALKGCHGLDDDVVCRKVITFCCDVDNYSVKAIIEWNFMPAQFGVFFLEEPFDVALRLAGYW